MNCYPRPNCPACHEAAASLIEHAIPEHLRNGMRLYAVHHAPTGGFLTKCFANDLIGAVCNADQMSLAAIQRIARWIYNDAPAPCHGSPKRVAEWLDS